jgi:hypothetical protein
MRKLILITATVLGLALPAVAQVRHEHTTTVQVERGHRGGEFRGGEHRGFDRGEHRYFRGYRGEGGRFRGWRGGFIGEIIVLDDGCYRWDGFEWVLYPYCD